MLKADYKYSYILIHIILQIAIVDTQQDNPP